MVCLFDFEQEIFEGAGLKTVVMGHPMVDQLEEKRDRGWARGEFDWIFSRESGAGGGAVVSDDVGGGKGVAGEE